VQGAGFFAVLALVVALGAPDARARPAPPPTPSPWIARQWANASSTDGAACRAELKALGVKFTNVADHDHPDRRGCGIPHGVIVTRGPTGITYSPALLVDCSLAATLPEVERIVQDAAGRHLGAPIVRIDTLGTFACRHRTSMWGGDVLSEHALGLAVDIGAFVPKKGRAVSVVRDYELGAADPKAPGAFLRDVYWRLKRESDLSFVLGPEYNEAHRNHFHLDRGLRWWTFGS
jgi:hypothetical protein